MYNKTEIRDQIERYAIYIENEENYLSNINTVIAYYHEARGLMSIFRDNTDDFSELCEEYSDRLSKAYKRAITVHTAYISRLCPQNLNQHDIIYRTVNSLLNLSINPNK